MAAEASTEMTTISMRLPTTLKERLEALGQSTGRSKNYLMNEALAQYIDQEELEIAEIEDAVRYADLHPEESVPHEEVVREMLAWGMVTQEALDRAEQEVSLDEMRRAQQPPLRA